MHCKEDFIDKIQFLCEKNTDGDLNSWEEEFILNLEEKDDDYQLSPRQIAKIEEMFEKYFYKEGN